MPAQSLKIEDALNIAVKHHQNRQLDKAEEIYKSILAVNPNHADSLHLLGLISLQSGKYDHAIDLIQKAISIQPNTPFYHSNLGKALKDTGRPDEAISCFRRALTLDPAFTEAYYRLGNALRDKGNLQEAESCYRKVLEIKPGDADAAINLGNILKKTGRFEDAIRYYRQALSYDPNHIAGLMNLGILLRNRGKPDEALAHFQKAAKIKPDNADVFNEIGSTLFIMGRPDEAALSYLRVLELDPNSASAYNNLGASYTISGKGYDAVSAYRKALEIKPDNAEAFNNLGMALNSLGEQEEAIECCKKALQIKPAYVDAHSNLLFLYQYDADYSPQWIFDQHREWNKVHGNSPPKPPLFGKDRGARGRGEFRLRIGYISPDFWQHSCAYFILPLLESQSRDRVEIFCYSDVKKADVVTERIKALADHWRSIAGESDETVADYIRQDQIDILVDLAGHTADNRLLVFARKPAPIQVTWLGYNRTTGLDTMDYRISDAYLTPPGTQELFSEQLYILPRCSHTYAPLKEAPNISPLPFFKNKYITFGSFNNPAKIRPTTIRTWAKAISSVPDSRLIIKSRIFRDNAVKSRFAKMFSEHGIDTNRLIFLSYDTDSRFHLAKYNDVDICLDTFPYNGVTTTCEALWMGVPVVSLAGIYSVSRVGLSILSAVKLENLVAENEDAYVEIVKQLALNPEQLQKLRTGMRERLISSPLCDAKGFAKCLENAFQDMWKESGQLSVVSCQKESGQWSVVSCQKESGQLSVVSDQKPTDHFSLTTGHLLSTALKLHQSGNVGEAEKLYLKMLEIEPDNPDALHLLGVTQYQLNKGDMGEELIRRAIRIRPESALFYCNLGNSLKGLGKADEAISSYQKAITLNPSYVDAYYNMGITLKSQDRLDEALACYRKAIELKPDHADAYNNIGVIMKLTGKYDEAIAIYKKSLEIRPNNAETHFNLANVLGSFGRADEAVIHYRRVIELDPKSSKAYNNLGALLNAHGKLDESIACYKKALQITPEYAEVHNNIGSTLQDQGKPEEAIQAYRKALEYKPNFAGAHSNILFSLQYVTGYSHEELFAEHRKWDEAHGSSIPLIPSPPFGGIKGGKLRIGYVSPDFRNHSCSFFLEPLFKSHDRNKFEIFCYSEVEKPDESTERLRKLSNGWYSTVGKSDEAVAKQIQQDKIDILVDLAGHTARNRLIVFAQKPSPIQVTWLGYNATSGLKAMDYRISDKYLTPSDTKELFSESLYIMPRCSHAYGPTETDLPVAKMPVLKNGYITFGSFNNLAKAQEPTGEMWAAVLKTVKNSRLVVKAKQTGDGSARRRFLEMLDRYGIKSDRIDFLPFSPSIREHLLMYANVDICLDTFPYNGVTTTCEALWMGVPVITLAGNRSLSRMGLSLLSAARLESFAAASKDEFIKISAELAENIDHLRQIRETMRERLLSSELCDTKGFAKCLENAWQDMWKGSGQWAVGSGQKEMINDECGMMKTDFHHSSLITHHSSLTTDIESAFKKYQEGNIVETESICRQILDIKPDHAEALHLLGATAYRAGNIDAGKQYFRKAIQADPQNPANYYNMGVALSDQGRAAEAIEYYRKTVQLKPDHPEAWFNMGNGFNRLDQSQDAVECYRKALEVRPAYPKALNNMGNVLKNQGNIKAASECFQKALQARPDYAEAHSNMLFSLQYASDISIDHLFEAHRQWNERHAKPLLSEIAPYTNEPSTKRRLRIGYVSPDFRSHSCAYFIEPLLEYHNRKSVEIFCYAEEQGADSVTERIRSLSDHWRGTTGKNHAEVAKQIRDDKIDILVDLAGHTAGNRLLVFARKPAPIQVTWLGYNCTTGLETIDYRLSDRYITPSDTKERFSEKLYILNRCSHVYRLPENAPQVSTPPFEKNGYISFGSFNNLTKAQGSTISAWAQILKSTPDSRLVIKASQTKDSAAKQIFLSRIAEHGIDSRRIVFLPYAPSVKEHLEMFSKVDICLDTFPYNGVTTTCEALLMGVPVITCAGNRSISRVGLSLLTAAGFEKFAAHNEAEYIKMAIDLAFQDEYLRQLRMTMRKRILSSSLCNAKNFAESLENAFHKMWKKWRGKKSGQRSVVSGQKKGGQLSVVSGQKKGGQLSVVSGQKKGGQLQVVSGQKKGGQLSVVSGQKAADHSSLTTDHLLTDQNLFQAALDHHQKGNFTAAAELYEKIISAKPDNADAIHLLGVTEYQLKKGDFGVELIRRAINIRPDATFYSNLGNSLKAQNKLDEAVESYKKAISLQPDFADAYYNMGIVLKDMGQLDEAVSAYNHALSLKPDYAEAHNGVGLVEKHRGNFEAAAAAYKRALDIRPNFAEACMNMGNAMNAMKKADEAIRFYQRATELSPNNADVYNNLGAVLTEKSRNDEAAACFRKFIELKPNRAEGYLNLANVVDTPAEAVQLYKKGLEIKPDSPEAYNNLGNALQKMGQLNEAVKCFRKSLELRPDSPEVYINLGVTLKAGGCLKEAIDCYHKALKVKPDNFMVLNNLGMAMNTLGDMDAAILYLEKALAIAPDNALTHSNLLLTYLYCDDLPLDRLFEEHRRWNKIHGNSIPAPLSLKREGEKGGEFKLRIGYVSPDFHSHSCSHFILPLFESHDRSNVEIFCYAEMRNSDAVTARIKELANGWRNTVGKTDDVVAEQIRQDKIDVLVDLAGHTGFNRLPVFARKPAPVQLTWLGYNATTGLDAMNFRLSDKYLTPENTKERFSESLYILPRCSHAFRPPAEAPAVAPPPFEKNGYITFGSFNNLTKAQKSTISMWANVLKAVPSSYLLIKSKQTADKMTKDFFLKRFEADGIGEDRIRFMLYTSGIGEHLSKYGEVDICLDTFPYNGVTTTCEALWMGVPVITCAGDRSVARVGLSLLAAVGLEEFAARNESEFVNLAADLANNTDRLRQLRSTIRDRMASSPLCNYADFAKHVEMAYRDMRQK